MFKHPLLLLILALPVWSAAPAQNIYTHKNYNWNANPVLSPVSEEEKTESAVILKDKKIIEYVYDENSDTLYLYEIAHKIVRVNDDKGVEDFNKVYVPVNDVVEFEELKARAITKDGKIVELNKNNIKELKDAGDYGSLKIFAVEGVEKGGEIEYLYITKSVVTDPYGREYLQSDTKIKEASIDIVSPPNLIFEAKSYNGFPQLSLLETDTLRVLQGTAAEIPALLQEEYSNYRANLMKVDYKISYNTGSLKQNHLYSWQMAAENFSDLLYSYAEDSKKPIQEILKKLKIKKLKTGEKVVKIEDYIKNNYSIEDGSGPDYTMVDRILVNKYANELGFSRLFAAFLTVAGIEHELVITSNRINSRFDKDFESWNNFTDILFFFPETEQYVSAPMLQFRYGPAPYQLANNYGLFIKPASQTGVVKYIAMPKAEYSANNIDATITFSPAFVPDVSVRHGFTGYRASEYRIINQYQKDAFVQAIVMSGMEDAQRKSTQVFNEGMENSAYPGKEFYLTSQLTAPSLIEKAGKNYLLKIGNIIGPQVELYQEHARQSDIDMDYPVYYRRTITFTIPDGYAVKGLEDAIIDKFVESKGVKTNRFLSGYKANGKQVTITAEEYYQNTSLPKEEYEPFRKVINAAADFNKVVLVFEKE